jgi:hypothetical protein
MATKLSGISQRITPLHVVCMLHAATSAVLYFFPAMRQEPALSPKAWVVLTWLWVAWPVIYLLQPQLRTRVSAATLVFGLLVLAPAAGTLVTYTLWWLNEGAP